MIRSVLACPGVLRVDGFDQPAGELDVVGGAYTGEIGAEEPGCSGVGAPGRGWTE